MRNTTEETDFVLLGFGKLNNSVAIFNAVLIAYLTTVCGNFIIIFLISRSHLLYSPMYTLLIHLSICDLVFTTNLVPHVLYVILKGIVQISVRRCVFQFYIYGMSVVTECLILTAMSYDRYLAICKPLHYTSIMDMGVCFKLVGISWLIGALATLNTAIMLFSKPLCGAKVIDHFVCDIAPLFKLLCSDLFVYQAVNYTLSIPLLITPFMFIIVTYICIFITIIHIKSKAGRKKTFYTCSSHLISVATYYGTLIAVYDVPDSGQLMNTKKVLFLLYAIVTPLFNPIIYSIRNQELRNVLWKKKKPLTYFLYKNKNFKNE